MLRRALLGLLALVVLLAGVAAAGLLSARMRATDYPAAGEPVPVLAVEFADPTWGGAALPDGMWCDRYPGSRAMSPPIAVRDVPVGANAILLDFNDEAVFFLDDGGGHGTIGFWVTPADVVVLPSVPPGTLDVGEGAFVEHGPLVPFGLMGNGYLPPCSGGRGNLYTVDVLAVFKDEDDPGRNRLLARGYLELGRY